MHRTNANAVPTPKERYRPAVMEKDRAGRLDVQIGRTSTRVVSYSRYMGAAELDDMARKRRRARQTHPGKRR